MQVKALCPFCSPCIMLTQALRRPDCWAPDYCMPETFRYKLCKLRLRDRPGAKKEFGCPEGEYCEELDCPGSCWLPSNCACVEEGTLAGRMLCDADGCFKHPSTQWGLCVPVPPDWDGDEEEPLPVPFHFYTPDEMLYNAKLHINEDSEMKGRVPVKDEL